MSRLALVVRRLALRTGRGPLRPAWALLFAALIRSVAAILRGREGTAYVRGSFGFGEPVYGLSDVDLIVVVPDSGPRPGAARLRVCERWQRIGRALPSLGRLVVVNVYEQAGLADATGSTALTYGLDGRDGELPRALFLGRGSPFDHYTIRVRPGLYGPASDWRLVAGPERRPQLTAPSGVDRLLPAWLDLQCWWRYAFLACAEVDPLTLGDLSVKLVAEPARIWLWLARGERCFSRPEALERALRRLPEEEDTFRLALALHRSPPAAQTPLASVLPYLVRMSSRLAGRLAGDLEPLGTTRVRLLWPEDRGLAVPARDRGARTPALLPLADWRARVLPEPPDQSFTLLPGSPESPAALAEAARGEAGGGPLPALPAPDLLVFPTLDLASRPLVRAALRAVQCAATDPVSFALVEGRREADFPEAPGWSARDGARRAVAEHRAWLADPGGASEPGGPELGLLFSCARASLFLESLERGDPELSLTVAAVAERLVDRDGAARGLVDEAGAHYLRWRLAAEPPPRGTVIALARLVCRLPWPGG